MHEKTSDAAFLFHRNGINLHINLQVEPDSAMLRSMSSVLSKYGDAGGRLFVDVRGLKDNLPQQTVSSLQKVLRQSAVPAQSIYFKGPMGFTLASDGNRVIIVRSRDELKRAAAAREARAGQFVRRTRKCACGGKCGDKCCQVTGGPCCSDRHNHNEAANDA